MFSSGTRRAVVIGSLLTILLLLPDASSPLAGGWQGTVEMRDGIEHVTNPKAAMESPATVTLREFWRIGGYSDAEEEMFGVITQVTTDSDGNVYLLDRQLSEVKVFTPDGEYLRTIGREGEGPGEFRQPLDMFFLHGGNLGVLQLAPGRVVMLTPEGDPAGDHPLPEREGGATPVLISGHAMGENLLLVFNVNDPSEGHIDFTRTLALIDSNGNELKQLIESKRRLEFVNFLFEEAAWRTFDNRWRVGPDGTLYAVEQYLPYEITAWDSQGNKKRVITREYEHWERTQEQKDEMYEIFDALLQNQLPQYEIAVSEYDPDITQLYPREDGTLWVLTSHGTRSRPEGSLGVFDVFDADGRFVQQVTLMGEGEPMQDGYFFLRDRLYVATELLEANIASRGGHTGEDEDEEEPEPISIICYELGTVIAGM